MNNFFQDLWTQFQGYYESLVVLLPKLILAFVVFILVYTLSNYIRRVVRRSLTARMDDPLLANFLAKTSKALIVVIAVLIFLKVIGMGDVAGSLLASAGVGAFILGFAFKDIGENLMAGIMLAFNRPFKIGDIVSLEDIKGEVVALSLRFIQIRTVDGRDVFIPNASIIKKPLINFTIDGDLRFDFTLGFDYGSDMERAIKIVLEAVNGVPGIMTEPRKSSVMISDLGSSTINLICFYWIDAFDPDISGLEVKNKVVIAVLQSLDEAGYYLPSEILEIRNYAETDLRTVANIRQQPLETKN